MAAGEQFTIAHISDLHCGGPYFVPNLMERAIAELRDAGRDLLGGEIDLPDRIDVEGRQEASFRPYR